MLSWLISRSVSSANLPGLHTANPHGNDVPFGVPQEQFVESLIDLIAEGDDCEPATD